MSAEHPGGCRRRRRLGPALLSLLCCAAAAADQPVPAIASSGVEVFKVDLNTRSLATADIDKDGRVDLALINNERGRIDLFLQLDQGDERRKEAERLHERRWRPLLSDARLHREGLATGNQMYALALGDLNNDGRVDLAYTGKPDALTVRFQGEGFDWQSRQTFDLIKPGRSSDSLLISDLDGDGHRELLMLGQEELAIIGWNGKRLVIRHRYPFSDKNSYGPLPADIDGDGRTDLLYLAPNSDYALRLRRQRADGGFGPEQVYPMRSPHGRLRLVDGPAADGRPLIAHIQAKSALLEWSRFGPEPAPDKARFEALPWVHAVPAKIPSVTLYALADADGDGLSDLFAADPKGARVWFYRRQAGGGYAEPTAFPSFSNIRTIVAGDTDGDRRAELFVASQEEQAVGATSLDAAGRLELPRLLPVTGEPLGLAILSGGGANARLACLIRSDRELELLMLARDASGSWAQQRRLPLETSSADPLGLLAADLDQDGAEELLIPWARKPAWLIAPGSDGTYARIEDNEGFRKSLLDDLTPERTTFSDLDGDGNAELLLSSRGYARALRRSKDGELEIVDQLNAVNGEAELLSALAVDVDGDETPEVFLLEERSDRIDLIRRGKDGVYRPEESYPVGAMEILGSRLVLEKDEPPALLYLGKERFWLIPVAPSPLRLQSLDTHESQLEEMKYRMLAAGDLNGDGNRELIVLDNQDSRILQVMERKETGWVESLHFKVFESYSHEADEGSGPEPREILVTDLTGDGRDDILLLVHDRVLLYPSR